MQTNYILRWLTIVLLGAAFSLLLIGLTSLHYEWPTISAIRTSDAMTLMMNWVFQVSLFLLAVLKILRLRRSTAITSCGHLALRIRLPVYAVFAVLLYHTVLAGLVSAESSPLQIRWSFCSLSLLAIAWTLPGTLSKTDLARTISQKRFLRLTDLFLANIVIILAGLELALEAMSRLVPSPLFYDTSSVAATISGHKMKSCGFYFNFRCNTAGYHDEEFFSPGEQDFVVAAVGDSFCFGKVPFPDTFVTVAENRLAECLRSNYDRVAIHNFGVQSSGMMEYAYILDTEVSDINPSAVLLCIYTGNDINGFMKTRSSRFCLQKWWVYKLPRSLWILRRHNLQHPAYFQEMTEGFIPDYIYDSSKESPAFSDPDFLRLESSKAELCNPGNVHIQKRYSSFFDALDYCIGRFPGQTIVAIIPDEFQVSDDLYHRILETKSDPSAYIRNYPQQRIVEFCRNRDVPCIDLLHDLQSESPAENKYFFRETHLNVKGNAIVGDTLGRFLCDRFVDSQKQEFR